MNPFLEGIILGMTLAVLLGPALFALIQTSISHGFRSGMQLATGIFLSDITLVFLCFIGALQIVSNDSNRLFFGLIAGSILIGYGVVNFIRHTRLNGNSTNGNGDKKGWLAYILKGYFLNVANPYVWLFWISVTVGVTSDYGENTRSAMLFFAGALLTVFATDLVKVYIAKKIKRMLKPTLVKRMNQVVGVLLFFFGVVLIARALMTEYNFI
jgi:threonine/homoserine/homoserine lactone efflux protein